MIRLLLIAQDAPGEGGRAGMDVVLSWYAARFGRHAPEADGADVWVPEARMGASGQRLLALF